MKEDADLMQYLTHMTSIAEQLREMIEEMSSKKFATVVLGSLSESFDNFLMSLNARNADNLDWENVKGLLIEDYMMRTRGCHLVPNFWEWQRPQRPLPAPQLPPRA